LLQNGSLFAFLSFNIYFFHCKFTNSISLSVCRCKSKVKILHVITSLYTGGAEKLMIDLLPRLKEKGHEVDLLLFDGTGTPFRRQAEAAGIKVMHTRIGGSVYNPINLIKLIPYLCRI
jgi:hypothetical protein